MPFHKHNPNMERLRMNIELANIAQRRVDGLEKDAEKAKAELERAQAAVKFAREAVAKDAKNLPLGRAMQTK